jgi:hypothetical protein
MVCLHISGKNCLTPLVAKRTPNRMPIRTQIRTFKRAFIYLDQFRLTSPWFRLRPWWGSRETCPPPSLERVSWSSQCQEGSSSTLHIAERKRKNEILQNINRKQREKRNNETQNLNSWVKFTNFSKFLITSTANFSLALLSEMHLLACTTNITGYSWRLPSDLPILLDITESQISYFLLNKQVVDAGNKILIKS